MENVAHALAGLLVARAAVAVRERREPAAPSARFASTAAWVSASANNVPDGDLLLTPLTGGKLGYLLHHRGHTHTLLVGIVLGLLVAALALRLRRSHPWTPADRRWLLALGALGPITHLVMDGWNVYGVHPFWPLVNRWFYGDAVFIVEPLLWLTAAPFLFRDAASTWAKAALALVFTLGLALPWWVGGFVPLPIRVGLLLVGALLSLAAWRSSARARPWWGLAAFCCVPVLFLGASAAAKASLRKRLALTHPGEQVVDLAISAGPANPLCWLTVVVSTTESDELVSRRATLALWPELLPLAHCPSAPASITAPLIEVPSPSDQRLRWEGEHRLSLPRLQALARERCDVGAALRFMRAPFLSEREGRLVIGDLRFDRDERLDFAELELSDGPCPRWVPGWSPPRARELSR